MMQFSLSSRLQTIGIALLAGVATILTYLPSLQYDFQFDDEPNILNFYNIRHETFSTLFFKNTRWISQWLNTMIYSIGKFQPMWYRMVNIGIHIAAGLSLYALLLLVLRQLGHHSFGYKHRTSIATLTMILFLLHPVQTQTVSYIIQGQLEGLASLVMLLVLCFFVLAATATSPLQRLGAILLMSICAILSIGTKEIAIMSPFLALLIDWTFIGKGNPRDMARRWWLHGILWTIVGGLFGWMLGGGYIIKVFGLQLAAPNNIGNQLTSQAQEVITPYPYAISQAKVILHYLVMYLMPWRISVDYDWQLCTSLLQWDAWVPLTIITGILAAIGWNLYKKPTNLISFGLLWFFICMAPRSSIIPACELLADYKAYLAGAGWLLALTVIGCSVWQWAIASMDRHRATLASILACISIALLLSLATVMRNTVWSNTKDFWHDIVLKAPRRARAHNNYGVELLRHGHVAQATWHFKTALSLEPNSDYYDAYTNLGVAYHEAGNTDMAILMLRQSLMLNPYQPIAYYSLGRALLDKNQTEYARRSFEQALALNPTYGKPLFYLSKLEAAEHNYEKAWQFAQQTFDASDFDHHPAAIEHFIELSLRLGNQEDARRGLARLNEVAPQSSSIQRFSQALGK